MQQLSCPVRVLAAVLGLVLFASACGSAGGDDVSTGDEATADAPATGAATTPYTDADATAVAAGDGDDAPSGAGSAADSVDASGGDAPDSLEDYLGTAALALRGFGGGRGGGGGGFGAAVDTEAITAEQQLIEIEVQQCMQAQGFDYVPEEVGTGLRLFAAAGAQGQSPEDFAATEGFGISTIFDEVFAGDIELVDDEPSPNDELLDAMSDGEAEAWLFALRGEPPVRNEQGQIIDPDTGEVIRGGGGQAQGGCRLDAQTAVRGDLSQLGDLRDAWDELQERIEGDPRIAEIEREWAACMLDRGFDYQDVDEARADFQSQFRPLMRSFVQASLGNGGDGAAGQGAQGQGGRGGAGGFIQALADQGLTDEQASELQALQDLEIAAAVAALECSGDTDAEVAEIEARYEALFLDENRSLLEAFAG